MVVPAPKYVPTCFQHQLNLPAFHPVWMDVIVQKICGGIKICVSHAHSVAVTLMVFHMSTILSGRLHVRSGKYDEFNGMQWCRQVRIFGGQN